MSAGWWRPATAAAALALGALAGLAPPGAAASDGNAGDGTGSGSAVEISVTIPATGDRNTTTGQLRWGINTEAGSGSFFGGCNFLSAGVPGNSGSSRPWTAADGFYSPQSGNVTIQKPTSSGSWETSTWNDRCQDPAGRAVGTGPAEKGTGAQVVFGSGSGRVDVAAGTAQLGWEGSFSVVFYGGLTYWWATDPQLNIANGKGTLTATASGYGSDRANAAKWVELAPTTITLATLSNVELGANGITAIPDYRGVATTPGADGPAQARTGADWGAFPQDFIDFQGNTGQQAYWYSSGGLRDYAKPALPLYVSYDAANPVPVQPPAVTPPEAAPGTGSASGQDPRPTAVGPAPVPRTDAAAPTVLPAVAGPVTAVAAAATWLGNSLIPPATAQDLVNLRDTFLWALAGLLALAGIAVLGFRRGWLVLPGTKRPPAAVRGGASGKPSHPVNASTEEP
ncbi:hypothetical protein [Pseudarthrobacter sp. MEB009]|uniref:hypothetical protein n=1 Tax=Pseudarthrobacter sp. MEB009 TaxID=3040326 RepID=UPI002553B61A|nr:hypothetical protein [Pseudarthrobacter sp. MEB009]